MEQETTGSSSPNLTKSDKRNIRTAVSSLLVIVALAIFGSGVYYLSFHQPKTATTVLGTEVSVPPTVTQTAVIKPVTIIINSGQDQPITSTFPLSGNQTAYSLLDTAARLQSLKILSKPFGDLGIMVQAIGEFANNSDLAWVYYINGKSATAAADKYPVQQGDVIEWKYVKPQF